MEIRERLGDEDRGSVIVVIDNEMYGCCSQDCARRFRDGLPARVDRRCGASNGCSLCGADLTGGMERI